VKITATASNAAGSAPVYKWLAVTSVPFKHNGHSVEADLSGSNNIVSYSQGGVSHDYKVAQFHFHTKAENLHGSKLFDAEVHFVAKPVGATPQGFPAAIVTGVWFSSQESTAKPSDFFSTVMAHVPTTKDAQTTIPSLDLKQFASSFFATKNFFTFDGSLTTPPCTEGIKWFVLLDPLKATSNDIGKFNDIFKPFGNARPFQRTL